MIRSCLSISRSVVPAFRRPADQGFPRRATSVEVPCENSSAYDQFRPVYMVDSVSATFDPGLVVYVYQPRASHLPPIYRFPDIEALHMWAARQVSPLFEHMEVQCVVADS